MMVRQVVRAGMQMWAVKDGKRETLFASEEEARAYAKGEGDGNRSAEASDSEV